MTFAASSAVNTGDQWRNDRKALQILAFSAAHGRSGNLAQVRGGEVLGLAATNQQQALGLQPGRFMQQRRFQRLAVTSPEAIRSAAAPTTALSSVSNCGAGLSLRHFRISRPRQYSDDEAFGFNLRGAAVERVIFMMSFS